MGELWGQDRGTPAAPDGPLRAWLLGEDYSRGSVVVNETTALGIAAYFASIRNISEDTGKLPLRFFLPRRDGGKEAVPRHDLLRLLNKQFNPSMSAMTGWETMVSHALGWQGGFFEIIRDSNSGEAIELWPLDPRKITVKQDGTREPVRYEVRRPNGGTDVLNDMDVFHLHGLGFDGFTGYIIARIGKTSIGPALAANQFRFSFFQNGAIQSTVIEVPESWSELAAENFRKDFNKKHQGAGNAYRTAVLEKGAKIQNVGTDPEKSQLVQTLKFNVEDVARWFRIPPNKIGHLDKSAFSNITEENRNYVIDTLQPWSIRICQEIARKLLAPADRDIIIEHDFGLLLEADLEKRIDALLTEFQMGMHSTNDLLRRANREEIGPDGDKRFIMSGLQVLSKVGEDPEPPEEDETTEDDPERAKKIRGAFMRLFREDFARFIHIEQDKALRAMEKNDLATWMNEWYPKHEIYIASNLKSRVYAMLVVLDLDVTRDRQIAVAAAKHYCLEAQRRILLQSKGEEVDDSTRFAGVIAAHTVNLCLKEAA